MKKYLKIGPYYIAIHEEESTLFIVRYDPNYYEAKVIISAEEVKNTEKYETAETITEELFQEKFSEIIDRLHNNTPYA